MTIDKKFKQRVRERMDKTGESYATARALLLREGNVEQGGTYVPKQSHEPPTPANSLVESPPRTDSLPTAVQGAVKAARTLEQIDDMMIHTPRDQELLVAATDPELGPYTSAIRVPKGEVEGRCRMGYRTISAYEIDAMIGEAEDFTGDWKHSE
jgi:hypothetical protein